MRISYLEEFIALTEKLSFTAAAKELHVSQSTLSKHLSALEADLEVCLLNRNKHLVELTDQGEQFLDTARVIVNSYTTTKEMLQENARNDSRLLMGGLVDSPSEFEVLSSAFRHIQKNNPNCVIHFVPVTISAERSQLAEGLIDCAFASFNRDVASGNEFELFDYILIGKMPCVGIVRKSNPLARKKQLSIRNLEGQTLVRLTGARSHSGWSNIRHQLDKHNINVIMRACKVISVNDYINVTVNEDEVFILPTLETRDIEQYYPDCNLIPIDASEMSFPIGVLYRKDSPKRDLIAAVAQSISLSIIEKVDESLISIDV